jgi:hypothetical protein
MVKDLNPPLFFFFVFYFALPRLIELLAHTSVNVVLTHTAEVCLDNGNVTDLACTYEGYVQSSLSSPLLFLYQTIVILLYSSVEFENISLYHIWNHIIYESLYGLMLN